MTASNQFAVPEFDCADDAMQAVIRHLLKSTDQFNASRGGGREMLGVSFRLLKPRARLSRSEMRGKVFSALGEFFWCLAGSDAVDFIEHYIKDYKENSDDGKTIHGAYGPRIFGSDAYAQVKRVVELLRRKRDSRRAVVQIFSAKDLDADYKDIPCTCTLQAVLRGGRLNLIVYMRSNDAYLGLPHDIFVFTMLQELLARSLAIDVGFYQHTVGHLHLYDQDRQKAESYLAEEVQSIIPMPHMPVGDPLPLVPALVAAEASIRAAPTSVVAAQFDPYWEDILRLLRVQSEVRHKLAGYRERIEKIGGEMVHPGYKIYVG